MKLKAGTYRVDVEPPFFEFTDSLKKRVAAVYAWVKKQGGRIEQHSPMPPSKVRLVFSLPKAATWNLDFASPKKSKLPSAPVPWSEVEKRDNPNPDTVDNTVKAVKDNALQIGALALLFLLAMRSNR